MLVLGLCLTIGFGSMSGCKKDTTEADKAAAELKAKQEKEAAELKAKQEKEAAALKEKQNKELAELAEKEAKKWTLPKDQGDATVKEGGTAEITIKIDRGMKNEDDVMISFSDLPKGVKVEPETGTIAKGKKDMKFTLKADADAPAESKEAKVTAKVGEMEQHAKLKITVQKKK